MGAVVLGLATLGHTGQSLAAAPEWPQAHSDLPADPAVRFGVLPNGMRYAIMRNRTPKDQVSMRFRLGVGSLDERDEEQGLAHFLEHMAFRGSAHVPEAEVWKGFQRRGMAIGADSSAYTQETQTFYQFDLPKGDAESIAFGLTRMRETASELTLAPEALETERGPVQSEERLRDTPDLRALRAQRDFLFQGLLLPNRAPIGKTEIIQHVQIDAVRNFYKTFYRPENATLIVVGDIDPDAVEVQIKARFSDWRAMAPARAAPDLGVPTPRGLDAKLVVDPNVARSILVGWIAPFDGARDTAPRARRDMIHAIGLGILNRRLRTMANGPNPPFTNASLARRDQARSATVTLMSVDDAPSRWRAALRAAEIARRQAVTYGVTQAEVDREVGLMRARM
ncbi:MAG: pitrilysin family protein [Caulobacteraceae bacterium]|nr:pitrilysin family protein [Caulobacteraceae bacterium]